MSERIAVLGAGAIGSSVGADLTAAKLDMTIIDQWPQHVEAMRSHSLEIRLKDETLRTPVTALHICDLATVTEAFDVVFLCVKSYDCRWSCELIQPHLKPEGLLVGVQNSMNDESIASIVGRERTIGCVVELSAEIFTPGVVQRNTARAGTWFAIGELDGSISPRLTKIESLLRHVGKVSVTDNILGAKWTKLVANAMTMGPFGLLGLKNWEAKELPGMFEISVALGREALAVGQALGYRIQPVFGLTAEEFAGSSDDTLVTAMKTLMSHVGQNSRTAPIHDRLKGRKSEMEFINGLVVRKGREIGIPTPFNDAVLEISREIDSGRRKMDPSNFLILRAKTASATAS